MAKKSEAITFCGVLRVVLSLGHNLKMREVIWYIIQLFFGIYDLFSCIVASVLISDGYLKEKSIGQGFHKPVEL